VITSIFAVIDNKYSASKGRGLEQQLWYGAGTAHARGDALCTNMSKQSMYDPAAHCTTHPLRKMNCDH